MRRTWDPTVPTIILACALVAGVYAMTGGLGPQEWRATLAADHRTVRLEMRLDEGRSRMGIGTSVPAADLEGFDAETFSKSGAPLRLAWRHDAGSFVLEGEGGRHPSGSVRFEPSASFRESWQGLGLEPLTDDEVMSMAFSDVRIADVQSLKASGVEDLDARTVIELARDPDLVRWVTELQGHGTPVRLRDVSRLRDHGLDRETYEAFEKSGLEANVSGIVRLHDRGVDPGYVAAVMRAGVGPGDIAGISRLHDHGVDADYVAGIMASGLEKPDVNDIVRLHDQGVDVDYVRDVTASGLAGITLERIVRLHAHGVPADYVRAVAAYGPGDREVDDAIRLHDSGVPTEFMRSHAGDGGVRPSTEETLRSWAQGGRD